LFMFTALLTDGDTPQTFVEWFCSISGAVIVWPVVVGKRLFHIESGFVTWPLWLVSCLLWAFFIEWILVRRHKHEV
jgi:purine-cytosine permease-like protein